MDDEGIFFILLVIYLCEMAFFIFFFSLAFSLFPCFPLKIKQGQYQTNKLDGGGQKGKGLWLGAAQKGYVLMY